MVAFDPRLYTIEELLDVKKDIDIEIKNKQDEYRKNLLKEIRRLLICLNEAFPCDETFFDGHYTYKEIADCLVPYE